MSIDEIKREIAALAPDARHELAAYLVRLEITADESYWQDVRRRLADPDPTNWISADDLANN